MASTESQVRYLGIRIAPNARMFSYEIYNTSCLIFDFGMVQLVLFAVSRRVKLERARGGTRTCPKASSIRQWLAGGRRSSFGGLRRFVELLQKRLAFRRINLCPLVEPRIV